MKMEIGFLKLPQVLLQKQKILKINQLLKGELSIFLLGLYYSCLEKHVMHGIITFHITRCDYAVSFYMWKEIVTFQNPVYYHGLKVVYLWSFKWKNHEK